MGKGDTRLCRNYRSVEQLKHGMKVIEIVFEKSCGLESLNGCVFVHLEEALYDNFLYVVAPPVIEMY